MSDQQLSGGGPSAEAPICPWCSATLPSASVAKCPSCGAALQEAAADSVPGVTAIDVDAVIRGRQPIAKSRGLLGWLAGEYEEAAKPPDPPETLEPPDEAVRREMLKMELAALEAEVQARQAEVVAEAAEAGIDIATLTEGGGDESGATTEELEASELPDADAGADDEASSPA
jgi:hypothetical protein